MHNVCSCFCSQLGIQVHFSLQLQLRTFCAWNLHKSWEYQFQTLGCLGSRQQVFQHLLLWWQPHFCSTRFFLLISRRHQRLLLQPRRNCKQWVQLLKMNGSWFQPCYWLSLSGCLGTQLSIILFFFLFHQGPRPGVLYPFLSWLEDTMQLKSIVSVSAQPNHLRMMQRW